MNEQIIKYQNKPDVPFKIKMLSFFVKPKIKLYYVDNKNWLVCANQS